MENKPEFRPGSSSTPTPPPLPASAGQRKTNFVVAVLLTLAMALGVSAVVFVAYRAARMLRTFRVQRPSVRQEVELAGKPISWGTNTATEADSQKRAKAFRVRLWVEAYQQRSAHNPAYDALGRQFLEAWLAQNYDGKAPETNQPTVQQTADELAANPACDDPLLLAAAAVNSIELNEGIRRLQRALDGFDNSRYSAYPKFYTAVTLASKLSDNRARVAALDASALELFKTAFTDGSFLPGDQPEIAEILLHGWGSEFFGRHSATVYRAAQAAGKPFEWLALVLEGDEQIKAAWRARGSGFAGSVSEQGWAGFATHLASAHQCLEQAWRLRPDLPQAPDRMIYVALGESGLPEMRQWFERTVQAQIDYPQAWSNLRWGLRPRWHGSLEAMLALGVEAVNTKRFDTDVPRMLFDVISDLESELRMPPDRHLYGRADIWPHVQQMYEGYIAEPSQIAHRDGWRSTYATIACLAGHYDVARRQLEILQWQPLTRNLSGYGSDLSLLPLEVAARTGTASNQIAAAERAYAREDLPEALRLYSSLADLTSLELDQRTQEFIRDRRASLQTEQRLQKGEWCDFLPTTDEDPNWVVLCGRYRHLPEGGIEVQAGHDGHLLYCRARLGADFEVRGSFERVKSSNADFQGGLVMGLPELYTYNWYAFRMKRNESEGEVASYAQGWSKQQVYQPVKLSNETNTFTFHCQSGLVTATVNGKTVFESAPPPRAIHVGHRQFRVGIGAFNDMNDTVLRYRNLQIRQLAPGKAPAGD